MDSNQETKHIEMSTLYALRLAFERTGKADWTLDEILKFIDTAALDKSTA